VLSVVDLLLYRFAGTVADVLGFLGAVMVLASTLPALRARINLRRSIIIVGAASVLYWMILYLIGSFYARPILEDPESAVGVVRASATPEV
jgi:hypothetical protein